MPPPATPEPPPRILPRRRFPGDPARPLRVLQACAGVNGGAPAPLAIVPERCNRCGACLRLGCEAISDLGGEALVIDAALCSGGGLCVSACRAQAIR